MKHRAIKPICLLLVLLPFTSTAEEGESWQVYSSAKVLYKVYGLGLGDEGPPTTKDAKVAFGVTGSAAKQMFDAMGPDRKDECGPQPGVRFRSKDGGRLICTKERSSYRCAFGFNLKSGKSIGGLIC
jgi:hypothetical protein